MKPGGGRVQRWTYIVAGAGALVVPGLPRNLVLVFILPILIEGRRGNGTSKPVSEPS